MASLPRVSMNKTVIRPSGEAKKICPFDKNHVIEAEKLAKHIKKCKAPTRRDFEGCPFNPIHWVHFQELEQHVRECPDGRGAPFSTTQPRPLPERQSFSNSYISQISQVGDLDNSELEMYELEMDFELNKPAQNQIERNLKKKINEMEMRKLNREKLWEEPNFADWFEHHYSKFNPHGEGRQRNERLLEDLLLEDL
jgi:hypothetical protein